LTPAAALSAALETAFARVRPARLGVAVSGGGDSLALLVLLADWAGSAGVALDVVTVDHRLRPDAADEARTVAAHAGALGLRHTILTWQGWSGDGNLPAAARAARYGLLAQWAQARGIGQVCLGHTADDQAETVLMNLARGSGVDGLAAMRSRHRDASGVVWLRPLLDVRRAALREVLRQRGLAWAEDPANSDPRYERIRARALVSAPPLPGLDVPRLTATARRMAAARAVLDQAAATAAERLTAVQAGDFVVPAPGFFELPEDTRWRLLAATLCTVSGRIYRPRFAALLRAEADLRAGRRATLHGCLCTPGGGQLRIGRETAALAGVAGVVPGLWDDRWQMDGPAVAEDGRKVRVQALGREGLRHLGLTASQTGLPAATLAASPALWTGADPVAAPVAGQAGPWSARLVRGKDVLLRNLISD
jgi:tRNA(Ile)-lysidine synthase